jgi:hypothetical protein
MAYRGLRGPSSYDKEIGPTDYKGMLIWIEAVSRDLASQLNKEYNAEAKEGHINFGQKQTITVFSNIAREAIALRDLLRAESRREVEIMAQEGMRAKSKESVLQKLKAQKRKTIRRGRRSQRR